MKNRLFQIVLLAIIACSCALMSSAHSKLTPSAQLSLLQKQAAKYDSNGKKHQALDANPSIRLVVEVDSQDAASTFAKIREAGATVLSKLGHQAVISIPADKVDALVAIKSDEPAVDSNLWFAIQHPQTALFHKLFDKDRPTLKIRFTLDNVPLTSQSSRYSSHGL